MAMIFSDFRPAEYHAGKTSYVAFYVINPDTGNLVRKRIKVNRVAKGQKRDRFARTLCCEINRKLYEGWNPYLENDAYFSGTSIQKGIREFLDTKGKNVRPDTFRSYHSYLKWFNNFLQRSGKTKMPDPVPLYHAVVLPLSHPPQGDSNAENQGYRFCRKHYQPAS